ncbi:hypothetical protein WN48_00934 [Eufriesea mexicana]|uniref:Uncharacterized protein n=1 Tax=Eufriesea mexicana TaxID=516756 RepID=A0A310SPV8_9HYME|nr:hypothetical protein WN48_00934 [Eufriesea mexicana]
MVGSDTRWNVGGTRSDYRFNVTNNVRGVFIWMASPCIGIYVTSRNHQASQFSKQD